VDRGVISGSQDLGCMFCLNFAKHISHLFFGCNFAVEVWKLIGNWLVIPVDVSITGVVDHFFSFQNLLSWDRVDSVGCLWWVTTVWCLWLHRNHILFRHKVADVGEVVFIIKKLSWEWFWVNADATVGYGFDLWLVNAKSVVQHCCD